MPGREQDPLSLVGGPLAASTPTATSHPPVYRSPQFSTLPMPQYTCEVPYTQQGTPPYPREVSFVPIPSYTQDIHPHTETYEQDPYASDLPCLPPPYHPSYTLSLGRDGRVGSQQSPTCIPSVPHPLGPPPDSETLGTPVTSPWDGSSDRSGSPSRRESSV